ncbi:MAG: TIGR03013 family PEP-CTERM/XrtA system glycosyltransferase [Magnetococcales bacterium]|nr:TIGR03013 family PEP-CTERM/XrtA system glycosyltransferase [Magnetococcales bacterium]
MLRRLRHYISRWSLLLLLTEFSTAILSFYLGVGARFMGFERPFDDVHEDMLLPRAIFFAIVIVVGMTATARYQQLMEDDFIGESLRVGLSFLISSVALGLFFYVFPALFIGRGAFALALFFSFVLFLVIRKIFLLYILDLNLLKRRVVVFGTGENACLVSNLSLKVHNDFEVVGYWPVPGEKRHIQFTDICHDEEDFVAWARSMQVDEIVLALDGPFPTLFMKDILDCKAEGVSVVDLPTFFERESYLINMDILEPEWWIHHSHGIDQGRGEEFFKKIFDVTLSLILLGATFPLMLLTALAILIESRGQGPVFYVQERVGYNGRVFSVMKFRSMRTDAEKDGVPRWAQRNDNRITFVGNFIRKTRLDELPQFFNVLRGEMSLIGPRPERPQFVEILRNKIPYYSERLRVKPGITGWAQVRYGYGASEDDAAEKLKYDLYYVKNHGIFLDLLVLIHSVEVVLFGSGATGPREEL